MSFNRAAQGLLVCLAAACASQGTSTAAKPKPKESPKASVRVSYSGGLLDRSGQAFFRVDEGAYVMVGHLGGDGQYEILYPQDGLDYGYVPAGKWFRTGSFTAYYDGVPSLYSFSTTSFRSLGARMDSYDGLGHGFVFIIASRKPLAFDKISNFGLWYDMEAEEYRTTQDPRESVRKLAGELAGKNPFTLEFARSYNTSAFVSLADAAFDCAVLSEMLPSFPTIMPYMFSSFAMTFTPFGFGRYGIGCGSRSYQRLASYYPYRRYLPQYSYTPPVLAPRIPTTPTTPRPEVELRRPTWRERDSGGRVATAVRPSWRRGDDGTSVTNGSRVYNPPSSPRFRPTFEPGPSPRHVDGESIARRDRPTYGGRAPGTSGDYTPAHTPARPSAPAERPQSPQPTPRQEAHPSRPAETQSTTFRPDPSEKKPH